MNEIPCFMVERLRVENGQGHDIVFRRLDNGEEYSYATLPPGAMYWAEPGYWEYNGMGIGPDGRTLVVKTPGGMWCIDSRAGNCTRPDDNAHRCWVRHGEAPLITVDKAGDTCAAGAGSIVCGDYHGFLRNGKLVNA